MVEVKTKLWNGEKLGKLVTIDTETTVAPFHTFDHELVLFQALGDTGTVYLLGSKDIRRFFNVNHNSKFVLHNAVFDLDVILPYLGQDRIFELIDEGKILCTKIMYMLYKLASDGSSGHSASLKGCLKELLDVEVEKGSERTSFGEYLGKPIESIPEDHIRYAALDVIYTRSLYKDLNRKIRMIETTHGVCDSMNYSIQIRGDYALNAYIRMV